ncbi:MAG: hypothetical protein DMF56_26775 [Acidobacteria bacterium]|nr:MAG: hypothetical protein DMF56_26775 [Acidobacteriota bacterium]
MGVLDNVIGVVVVILLLSMVVQSIQTFVKKLSNFKSKQIKKSLENLFAQTAASAPPQGAATAQSVLDHFASLGRVTALNNNAVESITKADLTKVVTTIEGNALLPAKAKATLTSLVGTIQEAQTAIDALANTPMPAQAMAKLAELRTAVAPMLVHAAQVIDNEGKLKGELIVNDVSAMRDYATADALEIANELQSTIASTAVASPANAALQEAAKAATSLANIVANFNAHATELGARLRERLDAIEAWYDPIMQGFEERYSRHMRTWAFIISAVVTVMVDANLPRLYKRMATDDVSKQRVLAEAKTIQDRYLSQIAQARATSDQPQLQELTRRLNDELDEATASYPALGLELLDVDAFWNRTTAPEKVKIILGWTLMAFLLSLGAPFWHDTLQSLFGLKNFLRTKTETKNVEQESGEGATAS